MKDRTASALSPLASFRQALAQKMKEFVFNPSAPTRQAGLAGESRHVLDRNAIRDDAPQRAAKLIRAKARDWKIGACQVEHTGTQADHKDGCILRFAMRIPYADGFRKGEVAVPVNVRVASTGLAIQNEEATAQMARKAQVAPGQYMNLQRCPECGETYKTKCQSGDYNAKCVQCDKSMPLVECQKPGHDFPASKLRNLRLPDRSGLPKRKGKRTAQFEKAPMASSTVENLRAQQQELVARIDEISEAVQKMQESARSKALKKFDMTEGEYADLENSEASLRAQYAQALQAELKKTKAQVLRTSDNKLLTLEVKGKQNPSYAPVVTFLKNFFRKGSEFVDKLVAKYSWLSVQYAAFETDDPKAMTRKLKTVETNKDKIDKFKSLREEADGTRSWDRVKNIDPSVTAPGSDEAIMEKYGQRVAQVTVDPEEIKDAGQEVALFNELSEIDIETLEELSDSEQLDASLPDPVTEDANEPMAVAAMFKSAGEEDRGAFRRVSASKKPGKREALLADGWSVEDVDAHLGSQGE